MSRTCSFGPRESPEPLLPQESIISTPSLQLRCSGNEPGLDAGGRKERQGLALVPRASPLLCLLSLSPRGDPCPGWGVTVGVQRLPNAPQQVPCNQSWKGPGPGSDGRASKHRGAGGMSVSNPASAAGPWRAAPSSAWTRPDKGVRVYSESLAPLLLLLRETPPGPLMKPPNPSSPSQQPPPQGGSRTNHSE